MPCHLVISIVPSNLEPMRQYSGYPGTKVKPQGGGIPQKKGPNGAFTLDVRSLLNENLGGILGGTQC
jgi:hypothetical protein